jgi:hypothetical protein
MAAYVQGQRQRKSAQLLAARESFVVCGQTACPAALRKDCSQWLEEVEAALPSVVVVVRRGQQDVRDARLWVDDVEVAQVLDGRSIPLDPGTHRFVVEVEGERPMTRNLLLREGERRRVVPFELVGEAEPPPAERDWTTLGVLGGVGALGLGAFGFFALRSHSERGDLESCKGHCPQDDVDRVRRDQIIADVSLGVGVVALGAAAYLYFTSPTAPVQMGVGGGSGVPRLTLSGKL